MSAICFSNAADLSCASFTLFSRAVASSCSEVILSCNTFTLTESALLVSVTPVESLTTSFGPVIAGADLSSAALLILPPVEGVFASVSAAGVSATMPANLLR